MVRWSILMTSRPLDKKRKHNIEIVVDRLIIRHGDDDLLTRLADLTETALKLADGLMLAEEADGGKQHVFSANFCSSWNRGSPLMK